MVPTPWKLLNWDLKVGGAADFLRFHVFDLIHPITTGMNPICALVLCSEPPSLVVPGSTFSWCISHHLNLYNITASFDLVEEHCIQLSTGRWPLFKRPFPYIGWLIFFWCSEKFQVIETWEICWKGQTSLNCWAFLEAALPHGKPRHK
jgi:hypothetical protein